MSKKDGTLLRYGVSLYWCFYSVLVRIKNRQQTHIPFRLMP